MARRMSNRDRIERMRAEAEATAREKAKEKEQAVPGPARGRASQAAESGGRMKLVWAIQDPLGDVLKTFPYPLKAAAEEEAKSMRERDGRSYIVCPLKVPMD